MENQPEGRKKPFSKLKPKISADEEAERQIVIDHAEAERVPDEPDNLRLIKGIGPKSAKALGEAGVITYAGLARLTANEINDILKDAGLRVPFPETWPEQAALAAAGKMDKM